MEVFRNPFVSAALSLAIFTGLSTGELLAFEADAGPHYYVTDEVNSRQHYWRNQQRFPETDIHTNFNLLGYLLGDRPSSNPLLGEPQLVDRAVYQFSGDRNAPNGYYLELQPFAVKSDSPRVVEGLPLGTHLREFLNDPLGDNTNFNLTLPFTDRKVGLSDKSALMRIQTVNNSLIPGADNIWHSSIDFDHNAGTSNVFDVIAPADGFIKSIERQVV